MSIDEIRALLNDIESDRVERTVSTTNTDKFGQAICAFANDLPDYKQAVMVKEMKSPRGERNSLRLRDGKWRKTATKTAKFVCFDEQEDQKGSRLTISDFPTMLTCNVYEAIKMNCKAKYSWLADNLVVSERIIQRAIDDLKELGYINKEHSKIKGEWQLLK